MRRRKLVPPSTLNFLGDTHRVIGRIDSTAAQTAIYIGWD